jgi:signal transduction histidine kinase
MAKDVRYLGRLVDDLFEFARIESGRFQPQRESIDLRELVDEAVEVCTPLARRNGVTLVAAADGPVMASVDSAAMGRVLRNLVDNAIEHSPPGGLVAVEVVGGGFRVVDQGPGFPPGFKAVAFDRFTRADEARGGGGAGLGLAIARGIVEAHGGSIGIEDGSGGRVVVSI